MAANYSETPRAPPNRPSLTDQVRQANSCITSVSLATRVPCTFRSRQSNRRAPPWTSATPADLTAAVTGSQDRVPWSDRRAVAASQRFAVPGAPPPPRPGTVPRALDRSRHRQISSLSDGCTVRPYDSRATYPHAMAPYHDLISTKI